MIFEVPCVTDPLTKVYNIPAFEKLYWSYAHHWYFLRRTLGALLEKLGYRFEILAEQRYDLSNHIWWMMTRRPGRMGKLSHLLSRETEESYKRDLCAAWKCDTLTVKIFKDF